MHRAFHVFRKQMTVKINHEKFRRHKSEYALIFLMGIYQFEVWEVLVIYSNFAHKIYHCAHTISYVRSLIWFFALIF